MSSRSQSSGRRSSSRSGSGRKSKGNDLKKTAAHDGSNFWVMLAGFVAGMTVLLLVAGLFTNKGVNSEMLAADDSNRAEVATRVQKQDFEDFVESATIAQLVEMLESLQKVRSFESQTKLLTNAKRQQIVVDALLERPLTDEVKHLAVLTKIKGTALLFWTDQSQVSGDADLGIRLREVAKTHSVNSNPAIAYEARIQLAKLNAMEATNSAGPVARELHQLLADFPNDPRIHATIKKSLNALVVSPENRSVTIRVLDQFFKLPKVRGDQNTDDLYRLLRDLESLCELKYFDSFENAKYNGDAGRDQLRDVCLDLAAIPNLGDEIIGNLTISARWLELNGHYKHAIDVYKAIETAGKKLSTKQRIASAVRQGSWGLKRCEAVGEPFSLAASSYDGAPLKVKLFDSMPILIVFWSRTDRTEDLLFKVEIASRQWQLNSVKIIAVQVESDKKFSDDLTRKKLRQFPSWSFCYDDGAGTGPIFSQIPRRSNGRIALLDRQHKLFDVEVDLEELVTSVNSVLATRPSTN